jgi:hypothetical protein
MVSANVVLAEGSITIPISGFDGRNEIFSISTSTGTNIILNPLSCDGFSSIEISFSEKVENGEIKISKTEDGSGSGSLSKIYESCMIDYKDIDQDVIGSVKFELKIRQSWLSVNDLTENDISLYSLIPDEWTPNELVIDTTDSSFIIYKSDSIPNANEFVVAEDSSTVYQFPMIGGISSLVIFICCISIFIVVLLFFLISSFFRSRDERRGGYIN